MRMPLAATAIALTALLASAATVGAERLITGSDIKDGSITGRDIRKGSLTGDRLEPASRHRVFVAKPKRTRQAIMLTGDGSAVATLKVPGGSYAIHAMTMLSSNATAGTNVFCNLEDNAGVLSSGPFFQQWLTPSAGEVIPMSIVGVATYTASATITLECSALQGNPSVFNSVIVAEQVSVADVT